MRFGRLSLILVLGAVSLAGSAASAQQNRGVRVDYCAMFLTPSTPAPSGSFQCFPPNCSLDNCWNDRNWTLACQTAEMVILEGVGYLAQEFGTPVGGGGVGATVNIAGMVANILGTVADALPNFLCGAGSAFTSMTTNYNDTCATFPDGWECRAAAIPYTCSCGRNESFRNTHETLLNNNCQHCACYFREIRRLGRIPNSWAEYLQLGRNCLNAPPPGGPGPTPPPPVRPPPVRPPNRARTNADPYVTTFDGQRHSFMKVGEFVALRAASGDPAGDFEVQIRTAPWPGSSSVSMNTATAVLLGGKRITFYGDEASPLRIDGTTTAVGYDQVLDLGAGITVEHAIDGSYRLRNETGDEVTISVRNPGSPEAFLDIETGLSADRAGTPTGLFGDRDGDPGDDTIPTGDFRVTALDTLFDYGSGESIESFTDLSFPSSPGGLDTRAPAAVAAARADCAEAGVTDPTVLDQCANDLLATGDTSFLDSAVDSELRQIRDAGLDACADVPPGTPCAVTDQGACVPTIDPETGEETSCTPVTAIEPTEPPPGPTPPPPGPTNPPPPPPPPGPTGPSGPTTGGSIGDGG